MWPDSFTGNTCRCACSLNSVWTLRPIRCQLGAPRTKLRGLNDLSRADGMPMRMRTIEGVALVLSALPADRVRQSWSVVTLVSR